MMKKNNLVLGGTFMVSCSIIGTISLAEAITTYLLLFPSLALRSSYHTLHVLAVQLG